MTTVSKRVLESMIDEIDIETIKRAHKATWFSPGNMRFFSTRLARVAYRGEGGTFFVTSEQCTVSPRESYGNFRPFGRSSLNAIISRDVTHRRMFSVRQQLPDGSIDTVGEFHSYRSRETAHRIAKALAKGK